MYRSKSLVWLCVGAAVLTLPGCPAFTSMMKGVGLQSRDTLVMGEVIADDFELRVNVQGQAEPAADYLLVFRRNGTCDYKVALRAPRRQENQGSFEIFEGDIQALWKTIRDANFAELDRRYPSDGDGPDKALGLQAYSVTSNRNSREVQTSLQRVPELEAIRTKALSLLPAKALAVTGSGDPAVGKSLKIVGDMQTRVFYAEDDPRLASVPPERRQPFPSWYDALNYGFSPAPGFEQPSRRQD